MPTITLISGQAAGLGFILALCHDFRVQKCRGSSLCIHEGQYRTPLLSKWMLDFAKVKFPASNITRSTLEGESLGARDSVRSGLVDETGFFEDALRLIERRGLLDAGTEQEYCTTKELKNMRAITVECDQAASTLKPVSDAVLFLFGRLVLNVTEQPMHDNISPHWNTYDGITVANLERRNISSIPACQPCRRSFSISKKTWVFKNYGVPISRWRVLLTKLNENAFENWAKFFNLNPSSKN